MSLGYSDTPIIPGTKWHVHDGDRPQPPVVKPGTFSTQDTPGIPPSDAVILFDGTSLDGWEHPDGSAPKWKLGEGGTLDVVPGTGTLRSKAAFGDAQLHIEFASPTVVKGEGQGRGNSGVFLMGMYEVQVLDNYENPTYPDGTCGSIYGQYPPLANACGGPSYWSVYDIIFKAPLFDGYKVVRPAIATVLLNGIVLHHAVELHGATSHRVLNHYSPHGRELPLELQDHGDLVRFRNIWYRKIRTYDEA